MRRRYVPLFSVVVWSACGTTAAPSDAAGTVPDSGLAGQAYVASRGCPTCHQSLEPADGVLSGQTRAIAGTAVFGRNLTPDRTTGIVWNDGQLGNALRYGIDDQGFNLCPTMPRTPDISDDEVHAINVYLRSLPPVHHAIPTSSCL